MSKLGLAAVAALLVLGLAASTASAQAPAVIEAVDAPGPAFAPSEVTVPTGTTVRWEFDQTTTPHTVTSTGTNWTSPSTRRATPAAPRSSARFNAAGTYTFRCRIHGGMTGTVTVEAPRRALRRARLLPHHRLPPPRRIAAGRTAISADGRGRELQRRAQRGPDALHRRRPAPVRGRRLPQHRRRGHPQRRPAQRLRALDAARRRHREHPRRRQRRPQLGLEGRHDGRRLVPQPPRPRAPVPAADGQRRRRHPPRHGDLPEPTGCATDEWYNFTAEPRERPRPAQARREHLRRAGRQRGAPTTTRSRGARTTTAAATSTPRSATRARTGRSPTTSTTSAARSSGRPARRRATAAPSARACRPTRRSTRSRSTTTPRTRWRSRSPPTATSTTSSWPARSSTTTAPPARSAAIGTIPVHRGNENGLLGITLDPDFATNRWLYLFYSAPSPEIQRVSRFTVAADGTLDMASEQLLLEFPHQRIICCHSSGSMTFGPDGNLYISTGDDTQHAESQGYNPIDDRLANEPGDNPDADHARDARRSSGNTNDLRGKILRIKPQADPGGTPGPGSTYTIPAGNLFGLGGKYPGVDGQTRPEIYTMGHRNPFRIQVDQETGWVYNGEVGPDAGGENANRGPRGYDELNQIREAGNMGWPYCIADNKAYSNWDFATPDAERLLQLQRHRRRQRRPAERLGVEHRQGEHAADHRRAAVVAVHAARERPELPVEHAAAADPRRPRPHGDRRPDLPLRPGQPERDASSRRGSTTRSSSPTGRATGSRRSSSTRQGKPAEIQRVHAERRLPAPAGHRDGRRRLALRARVGP